MNEIGNICLFNTGLFVLGYVTEFAKQFPDLWKIMPECIVAFLVIGVVTKGIALATRKESKQ